MKLSTAEIPCYLSNGIKFDNKEQALEEMEQRATDLGLPRSEQEIFIVVVSHSIERSSPIKVSEIASRIKQRKKIPPIEPKNVHPLLDRLRAKGLVRLARKSPMEEVEPGSLSDLNFYWFGEHYCKQKAAFEALSMVASLLNSYSHDLARAETSAAPQHYDDDQSFLLSLYHALFSANKSILVVANYFSALVQFPLLSAVLKKKKDEGVRISAFVRRESRAIPKMMELGLEVRVLTRSIPCRVMIIDDRSLFVNTRYEGGERMGAYYQNDQKQVESIRKTWLNEVLKTSEPLKSGSRS